MKVILQIAKTELQKLFYSPVAWLILIIFTFQFSLEFASMMEAIVQASGYKTDKLHHITWNFFAHPVKPFGVYYKILDYLYLYVPLLTMNIMSRELSTGAIKLLYSSPVTSRQIIFGKYVALMAFGLVLIAILSVFAIYAATFIDAVEIPLLLTHLMGIYLLICAYAAIGLFISSLTSYSVVAAMGTLGVLAFLNYVGDIGQEIALVRDITYWLSISGRAETFIYGLITSEGLLYFLILVALFLSFTIIKLQSGREKSSAWITAGKFGSVLMLAMVLGYFSSRPMLRWYADVTRTQSNTLSKGSQEVMRKLKKRITITTYINVLDKHQYFTLALPEGYKTDVNRFKHYTQFKPDLNLEYVYYYHKTDNPSLEKQFPNATDEERMEMLKEANDWDFDIIPYKDIAGKVDLAGEEFRFVRELVQEDGKKTFLRIFNDYPYLPSETEITAAFKRLAEDLPTIGFLTGHEERSFNSRLDGGYRSFAQEKIFRRSLLNNGFDFTNVTLDEPIPANINILVIADMKKALTDTQRIHLDQYLQRGDNLLIAGEPGTQVFMNAITEPLGVRFLNGQVIKPTEKFQRNLLLLAPNPQTFAFSHHFDIVKKNNGQFPMLSTAALESISDKGYKITTLLQSDSTSWNEQQTIDFLSDSVSFDSNEKKGSYATAMALSKNTHNKVQKILITGDADWLSNKELGLLRKEVSNANSSLIKAAFFWLSDEKCPPDMRVEPSMDNTVSLTRKEFSISSIMLKWGFTGVLIAISLIIWLRRRGR